MRIDRIRLANFCGVEAAEVRFAPTGVTIVHGPNEAGKSTLMLAMGVLFDYRDDSNHNVVRSTKPVNRDAGAEVEADVEVGGVRFSYFKRFHKNRETRLAIHGLHPENLSGREAHERVQEILGASVDTALWQALRITQGRNLDMPELHNQPALAQALDRAAGAARSGEKEEALFDAARAEYARYYTPTGMEGKDSLVPARRRADETAQAVEGLTTQLKAVEDDVAKFAQLERTVATQRRGIGALEAAQKAAQASWEAVAKLAAECERAKAARELADQALAAARSAVERRAELAAAVATAVSHAAGASARHARTAEELAGASLALDEGRTRRDAAQASAAAREAEERLGLANLNYRKEAFELLLMEERLGHVRRADADAVAATAVLETSLINEKRRNAIREAEIALKTQQAVLGAAAPRLLVTALAAHRSVIDGAALDLAAGESREFAVPGPLAVNIAGVAELRVDPGSSARELHEAVDAAQAALDKACAKAGVASPAEAETALAALLEARRTVAERDRVTTQHLRDLTRDALAQRIDVTRAKTAAYLAGRDSALPLPDSADDAATLHAAAVVAANAARNALKGTEAAWTQVQEHHTRCREAHAANVALEERARGDHTQATARLDAERAALADDALNTTLATATAAAGAAQARHAAAEAAIGAADLATTRAIFDTAAAALANAQAQQGSAERDLIALQARLDMVGDKGLAEALAEAERASFEAADSLARLLRHAGAARLLFETLRSEQEAMRRAYVAPLREGIERLGRHVFGPTLQVEVDEKLQVVRRTVGGVTVSTEQLSTGAKEQMGLIVRLAAAAMVSKEGGVPLVLDDALGSTDQGRIEAMGAVLRIASQGMQTIILTCAPERYVHVGAGVVVGMG